jgi:transcriptional antiterminator RfaH
MPVWAVARTAAHREKFAAERIGEAGFEVFAPQIRERVGLRWRVAPLFRGYIFARVTDGRWHPIARALGVLRLVKFGDSPARCPDAEIAALKAMIDGHGYVRLPEAPAAPVRRKIAIGTKVPITAGPFGGMSGLYAGQSTRDREKILLSMLGSQRPVLIAANLVAPA